MKNLVIVGNFPTGKLFYKLYKKIYKDYSDLVDNADCVIRMNRTPNYALGTGKKTTILSLINRGTPADSFASNIRLNSKVLRKAEEIWFTRPSVLEWEKKGMKYLKYKIPKDKSQNIIDFQKINNKKITYIQGVKYKELLHFVNENHFVFEPSSGFCVLNRVLEEERFMGYKIFLIGFSWEGWYGHNWKLEKKFVVSQTKNRQLFIL